jgi:hypothetical protein
MQLAFAYPVSSREGLAMATQWAFAYRVSSHVGLAMATLWAFAYPVSLHVDSEMAKVSVSGFFGQCFVSPSLFFSSSAQHV